MKPTNSLVSINYQNMKTFSIRFFACIVAFIIGTGICFYWSILPTESQINNPNDLVVESLSTKVTVCQLEDYADSFDGKYVNFQATTYVIYDGTIVLSPKGCYLNTDNMVFVNLELKHYNGSFNNLKVLLENSNSIKEDYKEIDIDVIGKARITFDSKGYKHCSIYPVNIQIVSPLRKFTPKGAA
jgi:hypothetical protein